VREPGRTLAHIEFTKDGRYALASVWEMDGAIIVFDAQTLKEVKRLPMSKPVGKYNVWNKITRSEVEGEPTDAAIEQLRRGVRYADFMTLPCGVRRIEPPPGLWERDPPVRFRQAIPTSWLELVLSEGKNRQIRRMTAHVGFPTLRLIRYAVGAVTLKELAPGDWCEFRGAYVDLAGPGERK
jgi:pseudouridine synthase